MLQDEPGSFQFVTEICRKLSTTKNIVGTSRCNIPGSLLNIRFRRYRPPVTPAGHERAQLSS